MTDTNLTLQSDVMFAQDQHTLEEGDITEALSNIHLARKPSPPHDERLHNNGDSESEEDLTEEHIDTNLMAAPSEGGSHVEYTTSEIANSSEEMERERSLGDNQEEEGSELPLEGRDNNAGTLQEPLPLPPLSQAEEEQNETTEDTISPLAAPPTNSSPNSSNNRGRSISSVSPSTVNGLLPRSQRVWEMDRQAPECRRCHRRFNFLVRRHHCRRCGQIVCDKCSSHRIRLPVEELIEDPMVSASQYPLLATQSQRVCDSCYREPIRRSSESHSRRLRGSRAVPFGNQMQRSNSSQSLMIDCPVCGSTFLGMQKNEQEEHLQRCLNVGSPPVQSPRYIVYELSQDSTQVGDECPICFDEFEEGKIKGLLEREREEVQ
ncbi:unnamed protein product [Mucor hiemalis]